MAEAAKKLNRSGRSHSGKIRIPYSLMRLKAMRNGRERKFNATGLTSLAAVFSFSEGENVADFTRRELSERYHLSKSSAERSLRAALEAGLIKRMDRVSKYKFMGEKGDDGFLLIEDWAYFAEFDFGNRKKENLLHNEVRVLFYLISFCRNQKGAPLFRASYSYIAQRLNLSKNTIISAVKRLKSAGLIRMSGRAWNGHTRATFSVNEKALKAARNEVIRRAKAPSTVTQDFNARVDRERYYAHLRAVADDRANRMQEKARSDEAYRNAEQELRKLDLEIAKAQHQAKEDLLELLLERQRAAQKQRSERLAAMGMTDEDLRPLYNCTKCSDTGFLPDGRSCDCFPSRRRP